MSPARKPAGLIDSHVTAAESAARAEREAALRPTRGLPDAPPARLAKRKMAAAVWRRVMREYGSIEAEIVTRLDMDHLVDYCILVEECAQLDEMRARAGDVYRAIDGRYTELVEAGQVEEALLLGGKVLAAQEAIVKVDARKDRKLDLIKRWRESLYITPRARAGTAPVQKEKETPPDEMEMLLDDVQDYVNGDVR